MLTNDKEPYVIAFTTLEGEADAKALSKSIVEERLAACVSVIPISSSTYYWEGNLQQTAEVMLMIKTLRSKLPALEQFFRTNHPYTVPELIATSITEGSEAYLGWIRRALAD